MRVLAAVLASVPSHDVVALCKMPEHIEGLINPLWSVTDRFSGASTHTMSLVRPIAEIEKSIQGIGNIKNVTEHFRSWKGPGFL